MWQKKKCNFFFPQNVNIYFTQKQKNAVTEYYSLFIFLFLIFGEILNQKNLEWKVVMIVHKTVWPILVINRANMVLPFCDVIKLGSGDDRIV
jgi:hypothetical protein